VADRDIIRTPQEAERNAAIKNAMRGTCVEKLVESWYHILVSILVYYYLPKVKVCLGMPLRRVGGEKVWLHSFLNWALDVNDQSVSCPICFLHPCYSSDMRLAGPQNQSGCLEKRNMSCVYQEVPTIPWTFSP